MPAGVTERKAALRRQWAQWPVPDWMPLLRAFLALPEVDAARTVLLFCGVGREPDTAGLIDALLCRGKAVALPRCLPDRRMEAAVIDSRERLRPGKYGIPEPDDSCPAVAREALDLVLVPNLCCDRRGYRLGHGAGYYDRYLAGYSGCTVALCPQTWLQERLPTDEFDLPVELVLTEGEVRRGAEAPRLRR